MKHSGDIHSSEIAEVELSAEDLLDLSPSPVVEIECEYISASSPVKSQLPAQSPPKPEPVVLSKVAHAATKPATRRLPATSPATSIAATFALVVVASMTGVVLYNDSSPERVIRSAAATWSPRPDAAPSDTAIEEAPLMVANPFDASEVFELPPGTSKEEARAMVADLLLKRASERQAQISTTKSKRR